MRKVLSIDGGGIRGLMPARFLAELERRTGKPIASLFDLMAGTSTGGILAIGLLHGIPAKDLADLYARRGHDIFDADLARRIGTADGLTAPKYSASSLEAILIGLLGNTWLSETKGPELLIPAYSITTPEAYFFKSWKARGTKLDAGDDQNALDFPLWQIARATSAAPSYFAPATVTPMKGDPQTMVDGGLFANNPAACALASADRLWPKDWSIVVALGTGALEIPLDAKEASTWGAIGWLPHIVDLMMDGAADSENYKVTAQLEADYYRYTPDMTGPAAPHSAMDDASDENIAKLEARAALWIAQTDFDRLCRLLTA